MGLESLISLSMHCTYDVDHKIFWGWNIFSYMSVFVDNNFKRQYSHSKF